MTAIESMENGVLILDVSGQLNAVTSLELHSILEERMPEAEKLIFEFKDLSYISSGGQTRKSGKYSTSQGSVRYLR